MRLPEPRCAANTIGTALLSWTTTDGCDRTVWADSANGVVVCVCDIQISARVNSQAVGPVEAGCAACSIGAAVVFPSGPMLIVFGMCLLGSLSMLLFELVDFRKYMEETR